MNKTLLRANNEMLLKMVNSIEGVSAVESDEELTVAHYKLFIKELDEAALTKKEFSSLVWSLKEQLIASNTELTLKASIIDEMEDALNEVKEKIKGKYIEEEVKQRVSHYSSDIDFYKSRYEQALGGMRDMSLIIEKTSKTAINAYESVTNYLASHGLLIKSNEDNLSAVAQAFAQSASPKIIIPDVETKESP